MLTSHNCSNFKYIEVQTQEAKRWHCIALWNNRSFSKASMLQLVRMVESVTRFTGGSWESKNLHWHKKLMTVTTKINNIYR